MCYECFCGDSNTETVQVQKGNVKQQVANNKSKVEMLAEDENYVCKLPLLHSRNYRQCYITTHK